MCIFYVMKLSNFIVIRVPDLFLSSFLSTCVPLRAGNNYEADWLGNH